MYAFKDTQLLNCRRLYRRSVSVGGKTAANTTLASETGKALGCGSFM
jgi:hypothetical protein